jgi:hypothetical protein
MKVFEKIELFARRIRGEQAHYFLVNHPASACDFILKTLVLRLTLEKNGVLLDVIWRPCDPTFLLSRTHQAFSLSKRLPKAILTLFRHTLRFMGAV